jgi:hypothetical protein
MEERTASDMRRCCCFACRTRTSSLANARLCSLSMSIRARPAAAEACDRANACPDPPPPPTRASAPIQSRVLAPVGGTGGGKGRGGGAGGARLHLSFPCAHDRLHLRRVRVCPRAARTARALWGAPGPARAPAFPVRKVYSVRRAPRAPLGPVPMPMPMPVPMRVRVRVRVRVITAPVVRPRAAARALGAIPEQPVHLRAQRRVRPLLSHHRASAAGAPGPAKVLGAAGSGAGRATRRGCWRGPVGHLPRGGAQRR